MGLSYFIKPAKNARETSIYASFNYNGVNRFSKALPGLKINIKEWNNGWIKTGKGKQVNSYIENELLAFKCRIDQFYQSYVRFNKNYPTRKDFISILNSNIDVSDWFQNKQQIFEIIPLFYQIIEKREKGEILFRGKMYSKETIKNYKVAFSKLQSFGNHINSRVTNLDILNKQFIIGFQNYLFIEDDQMMNSCACKLKIVKSFIEVLVNDNLLEFNPFKKYKIEIPEEPSNSIALTEKELKELELLDLSNKPSLDKIRDQFLLMCWSGVRISDLTTFCNIPKNEDTVRIFNEKTGREAIIPLFPQAKRIFEKYNNNIPRISDQQLNKGLKEIGKYIKGLNESIQIKYHKGGKEVKKIVKRHTLLKNHCGRRTLVTTLVNLRFKYEVIMVITSHTSIKNFEKYIKNNNVSAVSEMLNEYKQLLKINA
jgi:integrase